MSLLPVTHLSASSVSDFLGCPRRFTLRRLDKIVPEYRAAALAFGSAAHENIGFVLHRHSTANPCSVDERDTHFREALSRQLHEDDIPLLFQDAESEDSLADLGIRMMQRFWSAVPLPQRVLGIEKRFRFEVFDPATGEILPVPYIGFMDAVVENNGQPSIWEIKTARQRWPEDKYAYDHQITGYGRAFREETGVAPELQLLVLTKTKEPMVQQVTLCRTEADEMELFANASAVCRALAAGVDYRIRTWSCKTCEFARACR